MSDTEVLAKIRDLHKPFKIWDECDCDTSAGYDETVPGHTYITEIGWTCNFMYSVCRECCCSEDYYQTEDCDNYHRHGPDKPICSTAAIIEAEQVPA